ncbi:hypothetical protein [Limnochorda pilosa]|nr:hypothetical protein [Limnochorda pilosa]
MQRRSQTRLLAAPLVLALSLCLAAAPAALGQEKAAGGGSSELVTVANEYVEILVNAGRNDTGRFAVYTTGGDPDRPEDDQKPLIYGTRDPGPWTSYTTVQIDGVSWVFGGPAQRRAGRSANYGTAVRLPEREGDAVVAAWNLGPLEVTQTLSFARSLTTGLMDTVRIAYHVENTDSRPHRVGLRIMLDTMLGENDGAPFRVAERAITTDTPLVGAEIPEFWQAFDDLGNPQVMAQGTLRHPGEAPPERVYMSNWGSLADGAWSFDFQAGRDFTRKGEFDLDSAIALFWDPKELAAGEGRDYVTYYGLGGIDIAPGQLSLGLTSAKEIEGSQDQPRPFTVVAYVQNTGAGDALNVVAELIPPREFQVVGGEAEARRSLGNLPSGGTGQVRWELEVPPGTVGTFTYRVRVSATNAESNEGSRGVEVLAPARLQVQVDALQRLGQADGGGYDPGRFQVKVTLHNAGGSSAEWVLARLAPAVQGQLRLVPGDAEQRLLRRLGPGESQELVWELRPTGQYDGNFYYNVAVGASNTGEPQRISRSIQVPRLQARLWLEPEAPSDAERPFRDGNLDVYVRAMNLRSFWGGSVVIRYDPERLRLLRVEPGRLLIEGSVGHWGEPDISQPGRVIISGDRAGWSPLILATDTFARLEFKVVGSGPTTLALESVALSAEAGQPPQRVTPSAGLAVQEDVQVWLAEPKTEEP